MRLILFFFLLLHPQEVSYLDEADSLKAQKKYFGAESLYLSQEPKPGDISHVAQALTEISLHMGNLEGRRTIYQGYLTRSRNWRGVAALTLANLAVARADYQEFQNFAAIYFMEYPSDHPLRWRLIYHLARYTEQDANSLGLTEQEMAWFDALHSMPSKRSWPEAAQLAGLPDNIRYRYLLEAPILETLPPLSDELQDADRYLISLVHLRKVMLDGDEAAAASWINKITELDRALNRPDLSIHFYPLLADFFVTRGQNDRATRSLNNLSFVRRWAILPLVLIPDLVIKREPPPAPEPEPVVEAATEPEPAAEAVEPAEPATEAMVEPTEPMAEAVLEPATEPMAEAVLEPATEPAAEAVAETVAEPATEATMEPVVPVAETTAPTEPEAPAKQPLERLEEMPVTLETEAPVALDAEPALEPQPSDENPETTTSPETVETNFQELEEQLLRGDRGLELKIRRLDISTQHHKIYRNYLLGKHLVLAGRAAQAMERLAVAQAQVETLPFPSLEIKIKLAIADCTQLLGDKDKANWTRLQAMQIWVSSQHLPLLASADQPTPSPAAALLDQALTGPGDEQSVHQLIHYSETASYKELMQRAYARESLCVNPVLSNQLTLIGGQLERHVTELANNPDQEPTPRRYNDTLEIWNQLWQQTIPYYRATSTPSVKQLQRSLGLRDRVISFVEGHKKIGVLLISHNQAFALPLGDKGFFKSMNESERLGFLVGRLGPIWETEGTLFLILSPTFREAGLLESMLAKMKDTNRLRAIFSLKAFVAPKKRGNCDKVAFFGDTPLPFAVTDGLLVDTIVLSQMSRLNFETLMEQHDHLIYTGPLELGPDGLTFGNGRESMYFHQIVHYNSNVCSLTLLAQKDLSWARLLGEIELIDPSSSMSINFVNASRKLEQIKLGEAGQGVRFH